jgi:gamma-glutamyltranspeptidase / glutathione hydrolase
MVQRKPAVCFLIPFLTALCGTLAARQPEHAKHAMVVAGDPLAVDIGVKILQNGGNAVDAAVAIGFAMAVTYPYAGNLGGGGLMLVRFADGRSTFIDFREAAPGKASHDMYLDAKGNPTRDSIEGWRSVGVPGTVRGFEMVQRKYGKAKWETLVEPAVELASKGFTVSYATAEQLKASRSLPRDPTSKALFLKNGANYDAGDTFV